MSAKCEAPHWFLFAVMSRSTREIHSLVSGIYFPGNRGEYDVIDEIYAVQKVFYIQ
jgi:hypothetical protein